MRIMGRIRVDMAYDRNQRDELDARVAGLPWNEWTLAPNSPERRLVVRWMLESGLVEQRIRRLFPDRQQADAMVEFTLPRLEEKILHRTIVSNEKAVNKKGWWNPTLGTSFCAWVKQTTFAVAMANPKRVLGRKAVNTSALERSDDEGSDMYNKAFDSMSSRNAMTVSIPVLLEEHPGLVVPRPTGRGLALLRARFERDPSEAQSWARMVGLWHPSMDELDDRLAAVLLTRPLKPSQADMLERLLPVDRELARLYAQGQRGYDDDDAMLRRLVRVQAAAWGVSEWTVWCRLGTAAAGVLAG